MMGWIWVALVTLALISGIFTGRFDILSGAMMDGAVAGVTVVLGIVGMMMLWSGVMEVMREAGLMDRLAKLLRPALRRLFPSADADTLGSLSANVSANLLGLGNAATPAGLRAAKGLQQLSKTEWASNDLCMLVVINTASLQIIPTTIASVRAAAGAVSPFDILPAVWFASVVSQACGILAVVLFRRIGGRK